jgi:hypothetical protein
LELSRIRSTTVALAIVACFLLLVGTYTENAGFQYSGIILGVVAAITGFNQARSRGDSDERELR